VSVSARAPATQETWATYLQALQEQPSDWQRWHALFRSTQDQAEQASACAAAVDAGFSRAGTTGFLRATFLLLARGDWASVLQAREALESCGEDRAEKANLLGYLMPSVLLQHCLTQTQARTWLSQARWSQLMRDEALRAAPLLQPADTPSHQAPLRRVALVVPLLGPLNHPPSAMAHAHVKLLCQAGLEVAVFSAEETRGAHLAQHCGVNMRHVVGAHDPQAWQFSHHPATRVWCADSQLPPDARRLALMQELAQFAPHVVLYIGLPSPTQELVAMQHPVAALLTTGIAPQGTADAWLCSRTDWLPDPTDTSTTRAALVPYAYRSTTPATLAGTPAWPRRRLGACGKDLLLVTVGGRLSTEIRGGWAQEMTTLLQRHPRARWLLVGGGLPNAAMALSAQIQQLPLMPEAQLIGLLKACDVAVNPPRIGGGLSVALAMACGLPAVSMDDCDGGDKLGGMASSHQAAFFETLHRLVASKQLRRDVGLAMKARHDQHVDLAQAGPALLDALHQARQAFSQRIGSAAA
jgi:Glycosyl transferases group 1